MTHSQTTTDIERLVAEFHRELFAYAFRLTGSSADAEDLTQQTFLIAQQKIAQVREASSVRSWLYAVLRNGFLKDRRRRRPMNESSGEAPLDEVPGPAWEESPVDAEQLQRCLAELPESQRVILGMFYFEELPYKEIAAQLDLPIGTVMSRLARAKAQLRQRLTHQERLVGAAQRLPPS